MTKALVLGGGGAVGVSWETAIVAGLLEGGVDLRNADLIVGTSAGSACQSGSVSASHVLTAMGVPVMLANASLRLSLGCLTDDAAVARVVETLSILASKARQAPAYVVA